MKKIDFLTMAMIAGMMLSCSTNDDWDDFTGMNSQIDNSGNANSGSITDASTALSGNLASFDVSLNTYSLSETETTPDSSDPYYEDYVEFFDVAQTIQIAYNGSSVAVTGETDGVSVSTNGAHVTVTSTAKNIAYELSGSTTDGSFKIYTEKKFKLTLNGVSITNPNGAAINNQGKRCYLVLASDTENSLTDGTSYSTADGEDEKGTLFSEGKLAISGAGHLNVYAQGKNGIVSDDYVYIRPNTNIYVKSTASNGIKSNDGIIVKGGVVNVEVSAAAAKGIKTDGLLQIDGGRVTAIATGGTEYDTDDNEYKGASAFNTDSVMVVTGGEIYAKSKGQGGKGIKVDQTLTVSGGAIYAIASGNNYGNNSSSSVSAKAIKADGAMTVSGGQIMARASSHEAIETKSTLTITGGSIGAYSSDDAINSAKTMTISGGYVFAYSSGNDGIDSNGNLTVNGGLVIGCGATSPEEGIDAAEGYTFSVNGGTVIGIGGGGESVSGSQQKASLSGVSVSSGQYLVISDNQGNNLFAFKAPRSYSSSTLQLSSPSFTSGTTYTLSTASSASGNDDFYGYVSSPTVSSASALGTFTTSTTTSGGMGGGMAGGNASFPGSNSGSRPGGW